MWPRSGEIDVMESRGNVDLAEQFESTLHFGPDASHSAWRTAHFSTNSTCHHQSSWNEAFHIYQIIWTPGSVSNIVDKNICVFLNI